MTGPAGSVATSSLIKPTWDPQEVSYVPHEGSYFAVLATSKTILDIYYYPLINPVDYITSLRQSVSLTTGQNIFGSAAFFNGDWQPQDQAWVKIFDATGNEISTPWFAQSSVRGGSGQAGGQALETYSGSPWMNWTWQATSDSTFTVELAVRSAGDNKFRSYALFDNVSVPDASNTLGLIALSFSGLIALRRRFVRV